MFIKQLTKKKIGLLLLSCTLLYKNVRELLTSKELDRFALGWRTRFQLFPMRFLVVRVRQSER